MNLDLAAERGSRNLFSNVIQYPTDTTTSLRCEFRARHGKEEGSRRWRRRERLRNGEINNDALSVCLTASLSVLDII